MGRGDFELGKELGKGAQGCVYRARNKLDGSVVAIKAVELSRMSRKMREEAAHEVRVLSRLRHEHVIRYLSSFQEGMTLYIVTEIAEGGTMYEMIKRQTRMLQEKQVWKYVIQTALGLLHIHSQRILHRDVKTMNIFLTKTGDVKLGDLGVAKILDNTMDMAMTMVGTPYYLSPELCEGRAYNEKSDVWSLGCVLYELCTFKHPFEAANHGALVLKIVRGRYLPIPSSYSQVMTRIVDDCLQKDVRSRPTTEELLRKLADLTMKGELDLESYRFTDQLVDKAKVHAAISTSRPLSSCGREGGAGATKQEAVNLLQRLRPAGLPSRPFSAHPRLHVPRELPRPQPKARPKEASPAEAQLDPSTALKTTQQHASLRGRAADRSPTLLQRMGRKRAGTPLAIALAKPQVHKAHQVPADPPAARKSGEEERRGGAAGVWRQLKLKPTTPNIERPPILFDLKHLNPPPAKSSGMRKQYHRPTVDDIARQEVSALPDIVEPSREDEAVEGKSFQPKLDELQSEEEDALQGEEAWNPDVTIADEFEEKVRRAEDGHAALLEWFYQQNLVIEGKILTSGHVDHTDKGQLGNLEGALEELMTTAGSDLGGLNQVAHGNMLLLDALSGPMSGLSCSRERGADGWHLRDEGGKESPAEEENGENLIRRGSTEGVERQSSEEGQNFDSGNLSRWQEERCEVEWKILETSRTSSTISSSSLSREEADAGFKSPTTSSRGDVDATESFGQHSSPSSHDSSRTSPGDSTLDCSLLDETLDESPRGGDALPVLPAADYPAAGNEYSRFMLLRAASSEARHSLVLKLGEEEFSTRCRMALEIARGGTGGSEGETEEERDLWWQLSQYVALQVEMEEMTKRIRQDS